ncbi:hypothetical protein C7271_09870 [filamentous cyanobacterium CCP5]|nr:hypothetical protein C7271_09870 [filamentous cyanobacterium CCP5]
MGLAGNRKDWVYTLGTTGDTVVYVFPNGDALLERSSCLDDRAIADSHEYLEEAGGRNSIRAAELPPSEESNELRSDDFKTDDFKTDDLKTLEKRLLDAGLITSAQYSVASYDQAITGMSLLEVLEMRGWLAAADF